jgi:hypothetical protein
MPAQGNASQKSCEGLHHSRTLIQVSTAGSARALYHRAVTAPNVAALITARIAIEYRAKDAVSRSFTARLLCQQAQRDAGLRAVKQPGEAALCSIRRPHIAKKMSTDVHRF